MTDSNFIVEVPILFLVFNRLETTEKVFNMIRSVKPQRLYISGDGPRANRPEDTTDVMKVRDFILKNIDWECNVKFNFQQKNLGCKYAISEGINWFFKNEEMGIILEDDCLPNISFFRFCQDLLKKYESNNEIFLISADGRATRQLELKESYTYSKYANIWGWASWRRVWDYYDVEMSDWPKYKKKILKSYQNKGTKKYIEKVLDNSYKKKNDTWDYQLSYLLLKMNGFSILPKNNLVSNIGYGKESTHTHDTNDLNANIETKEMEFPLIHPEQIKANEDVIKIYDENEYFLPNLLMRILRKVKLFFK